MRQNNQEEGKTVGWSKKPGRSRKYCGCLHGSSISPDERRQRLPDLPENLREANSNKSSKIKSAAYRDVFTCSLKQQSFFAYLKHLSDRVNSNKSLKQIVVPGH